MKAVVWQAPGRIDLQEVPDPRVEQPGDAVIRLTMSVICGTDLHMVRGTMPDMAPGTVLGHEGVGVVEAVGAEVRGFRPGDRVVIPSPPAAETVPTAARDTTPNATTPIPTVRLRARPSSAGRGPPARSTDCRPLSRGFPLLPRISSRCPMR